MTAVEIIEKHIEIETKHLQDVTNSTHCELWQFTQQLNIVKKLEEILEEIKEQENE